MTDAELDRWLRTVNIPIAPRAAFADNLWRRLEAELADHASVDLVSATARVESATPRRALGGGRRPRRSLSVALAVAAVVAVLLGAAWLVGRPHHRDVTVVPPPTSPTTLEPSLPRFLPATVPDGLHLATKGDHSPAPSRFVATLGATTGKGFILVIANSGVQLAKPIDFSEVTDVNGNSGYVYEGPGGIPFVRWNDGSTTYTALGISGATVEVLGEVARSLRPNPDLTVDVAAPSGWQVLPHVAESDAFVTLEYIGDTLGVADIRVLSSGSDLFDQYASNVAGAVTVGSGDQAVVQFPFGTQGRQVFHKLGGGRWVWVDTDGNIPDDALTTLTQSIQEVSQQVWDATPAASVHDLPYAPDPGGYAPTVNTGAAQLDSQPGPLGSTCLRVVNGIKPTDSQCVTHTDVDGFVLTEIIHGTDRNRAAYGTITGNPATITVSLTDGTQAQAALAPLPGTQLTAWLVEFPDTSTVRSVEALDDAGRVIWRTGPPS